MLHMPPERFLHLDELIDVGLVAIHNAELGVIVALDDREVAVLNAGHLDVVLQLGHVVARLLTQRCPCIGMLELDERVVAIDPAIKVGVHVADGLVHHERVRRLNLEPRNLGEPARVQRLGRDA